MSISTYAYLTALTYRTGIDAAGLPSGYTRVSGLEAGNHSLVYEQYTSGNNIVIAFRGTDELDDLVSGAGIWFSVPELALQFYEAFEIVKGIVTANPSMNVILTGHSLGGGIAGAIGAIIGLESYGFNALEYEDFVATIYDQCTAAYNALPQTPINALQYNFYALSLLYDNNLPNPPDFNLSISHHLQGDALDLVGASPANSLEVSSPSQLFPVDAHDSYVLAFSLKISETFAYQAAWEAGGEFVIHSLFDGLLAEQLGFATELDLRRALVHGAHSDAVVHSDTVPALFDDLQNVIDWQAGLSDSMATWLGKIAVRFAGALSQDLFYVNGGGGALAIDANGTLRVDLSDATWSMFEPEEFSEIRGQINSEWMSPSGHLYPTFAHEDLFGHHNIWTDQLVFAQPNSGGTTDLSLLPVNENGYIFYVAHGNDEHIIGSDAGETISLGGNSPLVVSGSTVTTSANSYQLVFGSHHSDVFNVLGSATIFAGAGHDEINSQGAQGGVYNGAEGHDILNVGNHGIWLGGADGDTFNISQSTTGTRILHGGSGSDIFNFSVNADETIHIVFLRIDGLNDLEMLGGGPIFEMLPNLYASAAPYSFGGSLIIINPESDDIISLNGKDVSGVNYVAGQRYLFPEQGWVDTFELDGGDFEYHFQDAPDSLHVASFEVEDALGGGLYFNGFQNGDAGIQMENGVSSVDYEGNQGSEIINPDWFNVSPLVLSHPSDWEYA
ncbi:hypothetical protein [Devosia sp.]|uniref:hypothetical protein n=1 Tax=Devosia sp. TaxID=1871048 RepID=UPI0027341E0F|nr:hypothetical protein [Devosia sp.]MDP2779275.1 hypothetical protein [Devosia sp.]